MKCPLVHGKKPRKTVVECCKIAENLNFTVLQETFKDLRSLASHRNRPAQCNWLELMQQPMRHFI